jgi:hypothetical protein
LVRELRAPLPDHPVTEDNIIGFFDRIKKLARLGARRAEEPSRELGDFIEPGSTPGVSETSVGTDGGAAGLEQLKGLQAAGLIDAETLKTIEATMANATAELGRLHASGVMSDEIYAQAMASMTAATSGAGPSVDAAELDLLQNGESAPATVIAVAEPPGPANPRLLIQLEVHPAAGAPYQIDCTTPAVPRPPT